MRRFFPDKLYEFRNCFIACYLISVGMIGYNSYKSYGNFFIDKRFIMELVSYKIAADLVNIFDNAEKSLNQINQKIVRSIGKKESLGNVMTDIGKAYEKTLLKYGLSTGRFYWIDETNHLYANSEVGIIKNFIDLSSRDYLQDTNREQQRIYVGSPIVGASSGEYVIPAGVGAKDFAGNYLGTLAVSFKLSDLTDRYKRIFKIHNINFALLNAKNNIIFESRAGVFSNDNELFEDLAIQEINESEEFIAPFALENRLNSYAVVRTSDKYRYKIIAGYKNIDLQKELALKIFCSVLQFLIVTLFFVAAMFYLRKDL